MQKTLTKLSLIWGAAPKTFLALICTFAFQQTASAAVLGSKFIYSVAPYSMYYKSYLDKYCVNGDGLFYKFDGAIYATEGTDFLYHFGCYKYKPNLTEEQISKELNEVAKTKFSDKGTVKIIDLIPKNSCFNKNYPEGWIEAVYTGDDCMAYNCNNSQGYYLVKDTQGNLTCEQKTYNDNDDCTCVNHHHGYATKCKYNSILKCKATECKPGYTIGNSDKCTEPDTGIVQKNANKTDTNIVQENANETETQSYSESYETAKQALEALYTQAKNAISKINPE